MKSQHQFSQVPRADIPRSSFNLSHGLKTTFDVDYLIPILVQDIIPGDTWNLQCNFFMRLATPLHPILDNMAADTFFFFVPYRTIWTNFEKFHGAQDDPGDSIDFTIPKLTNASAHAVGDLGDYMGLPGNIVTDTRDVSALPFRAFRKIYNEWFRDENLQSSLTAGPLANGPDDNSIAGFHIVPPKRGKRFDYFTSCLPAPQKGSAVSMPLGQYADIVGIGVVGAPNTGSVATIRETGATAVTTYTDGWNTAVATDFNIEEDPRVGATADYPGIYADLTNATAATINDIRLAFQTQRLLERDARSGTRYVESLKAHWGVTSPDFRLQRAEFLGGGSSPVNVTAVSQQSAQTTPVEGDHLGKLAAFGTVSGTHSFSKSFVEHGVLIGIVNVRGDITYSQGLDRMWSKSTRYDFFYPVLSQIGEQSVLNQEIWVNNDANDILVFGYQERYAEYRHINSRLSGLFRVDAASNLASWHLSEDFATLPTLGATFIEANTGVPLDRAIAVSKEPHFVADFYFNIKAARPMPVYGVPGNLDRM